MLPLTPPTTTPTLAPTPTPAPSYLDYIFEIIRSIVNLLTCNYFFEYTIPTPIGLPPPPAYHSPFQPLPPGNTELSPLSSRDIDRIGSFLDNKSLSALSGSCRRTRWIFQARMKMIYYLINPNLRNQEIGPSDGMAIVYDKVNQYLPRLIAMRIAPERGLTARMSAILTDTGERIGSIQICWLRPNGCDNRYGSENGRHDCNPPYGQKSRLAGKEEIFIYYVNGSDRYSGAGTTLMQAGGMEFGLIDGRDCELRLWLDAVRETHSFYWNLRMRPVFASINVATVITKQLKTQNTYRISKNCGSLITSLPPEHAPEWRLRIRQAPILYATREQHVAT